MLKLMAIAEISFLIYQSIKNAEGFKNQSDVVKVAYVLALGWSIMEIGLLIALLYLM